MSLEVTFSASASVALVSTTMTRATAAEHARPSKLTAHSATLSSTKERSASFTSARRARASDQLNTVTSLSPSDHAPESE